MIASLALAVCAGATETDPLGMRWPFESPANNGPSADALAGTFDQNPAFHFKVRLPGPRMNSASHAEWSAPVLRGDLIFVGSAAGHAMYALSRSDGHVVRTYAATSSVQAAALLTDDRVMFSDTGGNTWCYTAAGTLLWKHDGNAPILVAPTLTSTGKVVVTNVDDLAVALNAETGALEWQYRGRRDLTREAELTLYAAPRAVVDDRSVLLGFSSGTLVAVDVETGEEIWKRSVGEGRYPDLVADPVTLGNDLFTSGYFRPLVAVDLPSRNIRWRVDAGAAAAVEVGRDANGNATLYHPGSDGSLRAVSALTGAVQWTWESGTSGALTTPVQTGAGLLVASSEGGIWLVDAETGEQRWAWNMPWMLRGTSARPAVEGKQAVFVTNAGFLYSLLSPQAVPERPPLWP